MSEYGNIYEMLGSKIVRKFSVGDYVPPEPEEEGDYMVVNLTYSEDASSAAVTGDKTFGEIKSALSNGTPVFMLYKNSAVDGDGEVLGSQAQMSPVITVSDGYYNDYLHTYKKYVMLLGNINITEEISIADFWFDNDDDYVFYDLGGGEEPGGGVS